MTPAKRKKKEKTLTSLHLHVLVIHVLCLDCNLSHEETVTGVCRTRRDLRDPQAAVLWAALAVGCHLRTQDTP